MWAIKNKLVQAFSPKTEQKILDSNFTILNSHIVYCSTLKWNTRKNVIIRQNYNCQVSVGTRVETLLVMFIFALPINMRDCISALTGPNVVDWACCMHNMTWLVGLDLLTFRRQDSRIMLYLSIWILNIKNNAHTWWKLYTDAQIVTFTELLIQYK